MKKTTKLKQMLSSSGLSFICEAHNDGCLAPTLERFETALVTALEKLPAA